MKMNRAVLTAVVIVVLAAAGWYMFRRATTTYSGSAVLDRRRLVPKVYCRSACSGSADEKSSAGDLVS